MSATRTAVKAVSIIGGLVGAAVLGGATAQRAALHRYRELDQIAGGVGAGFDGLPVDREYSVVAADGTVLHVEESGPLRAPLTVVFAHGWTLRLGSWHFQRMALSDPELRRAAGAPELRLVFYDQRSHGRSGRATAGHSTIGDLAQDLAAVIATAAPDGPVVLVGHSMGGMAVLGLAGLAPELFAERIAGVALLSTSANEKRRSGRALLQINGANPLLPMLATTAARYPRVFERGRGLSRDAVWLLTRALGFARPDVPAPLVDFLDEMVSATPVEVIAEFAPALFDHDQVAALPVLQDIPTVIVVGEDDRMTPPARSVAIQAALADARLVVVPRAGHMAILEAAEVVNDALLELMAQAWEAWQERPG